MQVCFDAEGRQCQKRRAITGMPPPSRQDNSTNGGHPAGAETLTLTASGGVNNRSGGVLMSRNALNVSTATLVTRARYRAVAGVSLNATDRLQNDGKNPLRRNLTLTAQVLANTGSGLVQAATLLLDVVNTVNGGRVLATGADVKGTTLNNTGTLQGRTCW